jgi:hypothetical protein
MKISFQFDSIIVNILKTGFRSILFNSACIVFFGLIYFFIASQTTNNMAPGQYFILSTKAQFLLPTPSDNLNMIEKDVILFQKVFGLIGFTIIAIKFFVKLFK